MARMMSFKADDSEESEISAYCKSRHFKNLPDFLRFAVFAYIRQNKPGRHDMGKDTLEAIEPRRGVPPLDS